MARNLKALVTKHSFKDRYKTAQTYLQKMKFLVEDVSIGNLTYLPMVNLFMQKKFSIIMNDF